MYSEYWENDFWQLKKKVTVGDQKLKIKTAKGLKSRKRGNEAEGR